MYIKFITGCLTDASKIASTLKHYLRNLDEPLLTFGLYTSFKNIGQGVISGALSPEEGYQKLDETLQKLPALNFFSLWYIMRLLHRYKLHQRSP